MMNWDVGIRIADCGYFSLRSRCAASVRNPKSEIRAALTLVELLITITIIATLAAMFLGASNAAMESARSARTKTTIGKIHSLLMERLDSYSTRRVDVNPGIITTTNNNIDSDSSIPQNQKSSKKGEALTELRLLALRELMKLEMPDRWSDILGDEVANALPSTNAVALNPVVLEFRPSIAAAYLRRFRALNAPDTQEAKKQILDNQGAECLYMVIMLHTGDGEARTLFSRQDIGDTDGDGALEFLDGWGRPIHYLRWPAGFEGESQLMSGEADSDHDPFDFFRRDVVPPSPASPGTSPPWLDDIFPAFRLVPLVYSAGPDGDADLFTVKHPNNPGPVIDDPYRIYSSQDPDGSDPPVLGRIGTPMSFGPDPDDIDPTDDGDNWYDNIHNHLQDGR